MRKYTIIAAIIFLCTATAASFGLSRVSSQTAETRLPLCVVLDAGHGGVDPGVLGLASGIKESDINLQIVFRLKDLFESAGIKAVLTRQSKDGLYGVHSPGFKRRDMQKRREIIQQAHPDAVISVHQNSYPADPSRCGGQVFFLENNTQGEALAISIQQKLNLLGTRNVSALKGDFFMLRCSDSPSVLVECGFLSNPNEESMLQTQEYQTRLSRAIFEGTLAYFC